MKSSFKITPANPCIFCGATPPLGKQHTGEHLFPAWFSKIIPKSYKNHTGTKIAFNRHTQPDSFSIHPNEKKHRGDLADHKLPVVCPKCNNGWMSDIERSARPVLTPLMLGHAKIVTIDDQAVIAKWATLKAIIGEFDDTKFAGISCEDRIEFFNTKQSLHNFKIWIGYIQGGERWRTRYRHHGLLLASKETQSLAKTAARCNTQASTIVAGHLLIHVISSSLAGYDFGFQGSTALKLRQVWPKRPADFEWPISPPMEDEDAQFVSDAIFLSSLRNG